MILTATLPECSGNEFELASLRSIEHDVAAPEKPSRMTF